LVSWPTDLERLISSVCFTGGERPFYSHGGRRKNGIGEKWR
jgi:hypothetical protein